MALPDEVIEPCPACGQAIDVAGQPPFSRVACPNCGATMRARIQFNHFTLLEPLGEGGMGAVFKAMDNQLQRKVALKILKPEAGSTTTDHEKLAAEARLTASINHPNVVKVYSFGEDHGQFYLAMELVERGSLDGLMELQRRLAEVQVLEVGIQAAEGLRAALEVGLIHRDIKPGNILFAGPRLAKIVDFGLARLLANEAQEAGEIWGTPFYVAPEKLDGRPEDFRSDIYSLGGTLFHALAGRPPFDAKTASMVVLKHIKSQAVSLRAFAPGVSDETAYVINRMLSKEPDDRYASYDELIAHLNYARQQLQKRTMDPREQARRSRIPWAHRLDQWRPVATAAGALVGVGLSVGLGVLAAPSAPASAGKPGAANDALRASAADLGAGRISEARAALAALAGAPDAEDRARNWARALLGLAALIAGDGTSAGQMVRPLTETGMFSAGLLEQPLGRQFVELGRGIETPVPCPAGTMPFSLLVRGIAAWQAGEVEAGGEAIEAFARARPEPPDGWTTALQPVAAAYLDDFRRYRELRDEAARARPADAARVLARIEQAKTAARTGEPMRRQLDVLASRLPL